MEEERGRKGGGRAGGSSLLFFCLLRHSGAGEIVLLSGGMDSDALVSFPVMKRDRCILDGILLPFGGFRTNPRSLRLRTNKPVVVPAVVVRMCMNETASGNERDREAAVSTVSKSLREAIMLDLGLLSCALLTHY